MINHPTDRHAIKVLVNRFVDAWMSQENPFQPDDFIDNCAFFSSHHGSTTGFTEVTSKLKHDTRKSSMRGQVSNVYVACDGNRAVASFYTYGLLGENPTNLFLFGSTQVMEFANKAGRWQIKSIRLVVNWSKGDPTQVSHWRNLPVQSGWQMGFDAPAMISELHSPWTVLSDIPPPNNLQEAMEELYFRYAFSVDQNDMVLLKSAYSEDISGGFAPVGNLSGRDQVIGTLKNFRHLAPYWQHFADIVKIEEEPDGIHTQLIVARIIPERPLDEAGHKLYGAHYQLRARKTESGQWAFCWTDYRPGWFNEHNLPEFDIGNATA